MPARQGRAGTPVPYPYPQKCGCIFPNESARSAVVLHSLTSFTPLSKPKIIAESPFRHPPFTTPPPTAMATISDMPPELFHRILSLAYESTHWIPTRGRAPLLQSTSLVAKSWVAPSQRLLMDSVTVDTEEDVEKLESALEAGGESMLVRYLTERTGERGLKVVSEKTRAVHHLCLMAMGDRYDVETVQSILAKGGCFTIALSLHRIKLGDG